MNPRNMCLLFFPYHSAFVISVFASYILYLVFAPPVAWNYIMFGIILAFIVGVALFSSGMYHMGNAVMGAMKFKKSTRCRVQLMIALSVMMVCGFVPRVMVYFIGWNYDIMLWAVLTGLSIPSFIHLIYFCPLECEVYYVNKSKFLYIAYSIHMVLLIASMRLGIAISHNIWDTVIIVTTQLLFSPLCAIVSTDMVLVIIGETKIRIHENHGNHTQVAPLKVETLELPRSIERSNLDCRICRLEYSAERFPLMLRECGHTVCQKCVERLMARYTNMYLQCPFCQMMTIVKTPPTPLAKNYMMWDLIEEMKKKN